MASGDGGLQRVRTGSGGEFIGAIQRREAATNQQLIPQSAVLIEKENRLTGWADTRGCA